jgi:hypothetical protein
MLGRLFGRKGGATAAKQQGDVHALDREGDPRGGVQSDEYRHSPPEEIVEEGDVAMSGPGGAPQDDSTPDERRARDRGQGS